MKETTLLTGLLTDDELIAKIINGEKALFEILVRRHNDVLYKIARSYGFNHQDAQDLLQEAHVAAYMQLSHFAHRASYKTWLCKILIHKCLYKLHYGYAKNEVPDSPVIQEEIQPQYTSPTERKVMNHELSKVLEESILKLALPYRTVFVLREIEGFNVAETAGLLGITDINVKVRLSRAKVMLQKLLEQIYCTADLFEFNAIYCDAVVHNVFQQINEKEQQHEQ